MPATCTNLLKAYSFIYIVKLVSTNLAKLNPLRALWPMEPTLISGFYSVKRVRTELDETLIHHWLAPSVNLQA